MIDAMNKFVLVVMMIFSSSSIAEDKTESGKKSKDKEVKEAVSDNPSIRLESVFVGDKEQPSVSYFIPWKGNTTPDKLQWNMEEKYDQALQVIDRDVLLNSMHIYNELNLETISPIDK